MTRDSEDFPVAIIPTRPAGLEPLKDRFDKLARRIADPLVTLFTLQLSSDPDLQFKAAAELMPYRHRKLKPQEDPSDRGATGQQVNVQINFSDGSSKQVSLPSSVTPTNPLD
jgi:hypothetical protein